MLKSWPAYLNNNNIIITKKFAQRVTDSKLNVDVVKAYSCALSPNGLLYLPLRGLYISYAVSLFCMSFFRYAINKSIFCKKRKKLNFFLSTFESIWTWNILHKFLTAISTQTWKNIHFVLNLLSFPSFMNRRVQIKDNTFWKKHVVACIFNLKGQITSDVLMDLL